ncbi:MAG: hypothetical protein FJ033_15210 [Chloroflexi bacterium]|nr:hypothetical protein [Chloroflexota bacterium]
MCTYITASAAIQGSGKGTSGWFPLSQATIGFDHPVHAPYDHALLLDFADPKQGPSARVAVEIDLASARALLTQLESVVRQAEETGLR